MLGGVPRELGIESEAEVGTKRTGCFQIGLASPRLADTAELGGLLDFGPARVPSQDGLGSPPSLEPFTGRQTAELPPPHLTRAL